MKLFFSCSVPLRRVKCSTTNHQDCDLRRADRPAPICCPFETALDALAVHGTLSPSVEDPWPEAKSRNSTFAAFPPPPTMENKEKVCACVFECSAYIGKGAAGGGTRQRDEARPILLISV